MTCSAHVLDSWNVSKFSWIQQSRRCLNKILISLYKLTPKV